MIETRIDALDFLAQLGDEVVLDYTATAETITTIVTELLALQEHGTPITVGTIDSTETRTLTVEQDTILGVLTKLRETVGGYISVNNSRELDWLDDIGEDVGQQIRYKKNIKGLSRTREYTNFGNKLYCYGAGEGTARVKLSDSDALAVDYIEDGASQGTYGICIRTLVDKSITNANVLYDWAVLRIAEMKDPRTSYRVDMINLAAMGWDFEVLQLGSIVDVIDEDLGIDISARVVHIIRDLSDPLNIEIEISNIGKDIIDTASSTYITQQYQESTSPPAGGETIKTVNGPIAIYGSGLLFYNSPTDARVGYIYGTGSGATGLLNIFGDGDVRFQHRQSLNGSLLWDITTSATIGVLRPVVDARCNIGTTTLRFGYGFFDDIYYTGGSLPDDMDDVELVNGIKQDKDGKIDMSTFPAFLKDKNNNINVGGTINLLIGTCKQLSAKVKALE